MGSLPDRHSIVWGWISIRIGIATFTDTFRTGQAIDWGGIDYWLGVFAISGLSALTNAFAIVGFVTLIDASRNRQRSLPGWLPATLGICTVMNLGWVFGALAALREGYFLWLLSFPALMLAARTMLKQRPRDPKTVLWSRWLAPARVAIPLVLAAGVVTVVTVAVAFWVLGSVATVVESWRGG